MSEGSEMSFMFLLGQHRVLKDLEFMATTKQG